MVIPRDMTLQMQPLYVYINRPFKAELKKLCTKWLSSGENKNWAGKTCPVL